MEVILLKVTGSAVMIGLAGLVTAIFACWGGKQERIGEVMMLTALSIIAVCGFAFIWITEI